MSRKLVILIIAIVCLTVSAFVLAQTFAEMQKVADDNKEVKLLILKEITGFYEGKPEQVYSCYAPDRFVGYSTGETPEDWRVRPASFNLREYADGAKTFKANWDKHPDWSRRCKVTLVDIVGNNGIAVSKQWFTRNYEDTREVLNNMFQSVFFVTKIRGEWKITGFVGGVKWNWEIFRMPPQP